MGNGLTQHRSTIGNLTMVPSGTPLYDDVWGLLGLPQEPSQLGGFMRGDQCWLSSHIMVLFTDCTDQ